MVLEAAVKGVQLYGLKARIICNAHERDLLARVAARKWPDVEVEFIVRGRPSPRLT